MIHQFNFPTVVRFGEGVVRELGDYLKSQVCQRPLLITDGVVAKLTFFEKIMSDLRRQGLSPELFCDISKNPVKSDVLKGNRAYHEHESDAIVGLGGGAAMDVARAVALSINNTRDLLEYDELTGGDQYIRSEEHTSELQSQSTISYAVFCLKKKKKSKNEESVFMVYTLPDYSPYYRRY